MIQNLPQGTRIMTNSTHRAIRRLGALTALSTLAVVAVPGIAGAANGNGIESKSGKQIFQTGAQNSFGAHTFMLAGTIKSGGQAVTINVTVGQAQGSGSIAMKGTKIRLALVNGTVYIEAPVAYYQSQGANQTQAAQYGGKWLSASATDPQYTKTVNFLTSSALQASFLASYQNKNYISYTKGSSTKVNGASVVKVDVRDPKNPGNNATAYVTETGTPYLVRLASTGNDKEKGQITFSKFNAPLAVQPPAGAISAPSSS